MGNLHKLLDMLGGALGALAPRQARLDGRDVERLGIVIYEAMSQPTRSYHSIEHALQVAQGDDAVACLAGLFHDTVYLQIDRQQIAPGALAVLDDLTNAPRSAAERQCLAMFGGSGGFQSLKADAGLNEGLSALLATRMLGTLLRAEDLLGVQAAIEATIPFRGETAHRHAAERLAKIDADGQIGLGEAGVRQIAARATRVANRDVESFGSQTVADFLASTWLLFSELDPTLNRGRLYSVTSYRRALFGMERFLSVRLNPKRVFHIAGSVEDRAAAEAARQRARVNLTAAIIYMRVKLFAVALIEAVAAATGGDGPIELFLGEASDSQSVAAWAGKRLDAKAHLVDGHEDLIDTEIFELLWIGRNGSSSFDLPNSPLAALYYAERGGPYCVDRFEDVMHFVDGSIDGETLLTRQDPKLVIELAERIAIVAPTRRAAAFALIRRIRASSRRTRASA